MDKNSGKERVVRERQEHGTGAATTTSTEATTFIVVQGGWIEVSNEIAREKVSHGFRTKTKRNGNASRKNYDQRQLPVTTTTAGTMGTTKKRSSPSMTASMKVINSSNSNIDYESKNVWSRFFGTASNGAKVYRIGGKEVEYHCMNNDDNKDLTHNVQEKEVDNNDDFQWLHGFDDHGDDDMDSDYEEEKKDGCSCSKTNNHHPLHLQFDEPTSQQCKKLRR